MRNVGRASTRRDRTTTKTPLRRLFVRAFCRAITRAIGNTVVMETDATKRTTVVLEAFWEASSDDLESSTNRTLRLKCRDTHVVAFLFGIRAADLRGWTRIGKAFSRMLAWFFHSHRGFSPVLATTHTNPKPFKRFPNLRAADKSALPHGRATAPSTHPLTQVVLTKTSGK